MAVRAPGVLAAERFLRARFSHRPAAAVALRAVADPPAELGYIADSSVTLQVPGWRSVTVPAAGVGFRGHLPAAAGRPPRAGRRGHGCQPERGAPHVSLCAHRGHAIEPVRPQAMRWDVVPRLFTPDGATALLLAHRNLPPFDLEQPCVLTRCFEAPSSPTQAYATRPLCSRLARRLRALSKGGIRER